MTGILLLAAGESSRLGQPKQLLPWHGIPLIRHAAAVALQADLGPVTVVLGAVDVPCRVALESLPLRIVHHDGWASGMGGSIAAGINAMTDDDLSAVIILLCDQPLIDAAILGHLDAVGRRGGHPVVASRFAGADGPPAWFAAAKFPELLALDGQQGAKAVLRQEPALFSVDCPQAGSDIDTLDDWKMLMERSGN